MEGREKAASQEAQNVLQGKPQVLAPLGVVGFMDYPLDEAAMPKRPCRWKKVKLTTNELMCRPCEGYEF